MNAWKKHERIVDCDLYLGDCLDVIPTLATVDAVVTDLPYGTTACAWDSVVPLEKMWPIILQCAKPFAPLVFTASQPFTSSLGASNLRMLKYSWVWEKNRSTGHVHAKNKPMKRHEDVLVFSTGTTVHASQSASRMTYNPQGITKLNTPHTRRRNDKGDDTIMSARKSHKPSIQEHSGYPDSIVKFDIPMGSERFHPAQKPVALMEYLILTYSNEGDTILDFTMGSGTTLVACAKLGRRGIGIEMDPDYFAIACRRVENAYCRPAQLSLLDSIEQKVTIA